MDKPTIDHILEMVRLSHAPVGASPTYRYAYNAALRHVVANLERLRDEAASENKLPEIEARLAELEKTVFGVGGVTEA